MNLKQLFCRPHDWGITGPAYPYLIGIDNPFTPYNTGWNRAWRIPIKCKKCGAKWWRHRSAPKLLNRPVHLGWSAPESLINLAKSITKKVSGLNEKQLLKLGDYIKEIELSCDACNFKTTTVDELQKHIWDEHRELLENDVLHIYLQSSNGSETPE